MRSRGRHLLWAALLVLPEAVDGLPGAASPVERVVAEIAGEPVFRTEWLAARTLQPAALSPQESLERYVDTRLLAREAARFRLTGVTARMEADVSVLRERGVGEAMARRIARYRAMADRLVVLRFRQVTVILDAEVVAHHRAHRDRFPGPLDAERNRVREELAEIKAQQAVAELLGRLYRTELVILRPLQEARVRTADRASW